MEQTLCVYSTVGGSVMSMGHLKEAVEYETYEEYCAPRREIGLGVIPESLFDALKEEEENECN